MAQGWVIVDPNNEEEFGPIVNRLIGEDHS
jgi:hypothetical protein